MKQNVLTKNRLNCQLCDTLVLYWFWSRYFEV